MPVRKGAESASVVVTTQDYQITRTIKPDGKSSITVKSADGKATFNSPQALLDGMCGTLAFDPTSFVRMSAKDQRQTLVRLTGLDTTAIDREIESIAAERTDIGRDGKSASANVDSAPHYPDAPAEPVDVRDLMAELTAIQRANQQGAAEAREANRKRDVAIATGRSHQNDYNNGIAEIERLEARIAELRKSTEAAKRAAEAIAAELPEVVTFAAADTAAIEARIAESGAVNAHVAANARRLELTAQRDALRARYAELTEKLEDARARKAKQVADTEMPVDGLEVTADGVMFNGIPLSQCSQAEQLKIAFGMATAQQSDLRVCILRDGAFLDDESLAQVLALASHNQMQVWIERVGTGDEGAIIIEDGHVVEV
jgi:hypothetical protein